MAQTRATDDIHAIVARFPQRELDIRRRCARDAHFRSICEDYQEAVTALRHWQRANDRRVEEYRQIVGELEAEILAQLRLMGT